MVPPFRAPFRGRLPWQARDRWPSARCACGAAEGRRGAEGGDVHRTGVTLEGLRRIVGGGVLRKVMWWRTRVFREGVSGGAVSLLDGIQAAFAYMGGPFHCSLTVVRVVRPRPADPNRASGEGRDGSDPPFFTAGAVRQEGGCPTQCPTGCPIPSPPLGGSLPSVGIPAIWTPPSMQGFHPSWKGEIRRSLLTGGRNCASGYRVLTGTKTRGDEPTAGPIFGL